MELTHLCSEASKYTTDLLVKVTFPLLSLICSYATLPNRLYIKLYISEYFITTINSLKIPKKLFKGFSFYKNNDDANVKWHNHNITQILVMLLCLEYLYLYIF